MFEFSDSLLQDNHLPIFNECDSTSFIDDFVFVESEVCKDRIATKLSQKRSSQLLSSCWTGMSPLLRRWSLAQGKQM